MTKEQFINAKTEIAKKVLPHLVDPDGFDGMSAEKSVKVIANELKTFDKKLFEKPRILTASDASV